MKNSLSQDSKFLEVFIKQLLGEKDYIHVLSLFERLEEKHSFENFSGKKFTPLLWAIG